VSTAIANVHDPDFDADATRPGFSYRRARVGRQAGAERLGASVYEVPPGQATFPYHYHLANEELLIVLKGCPHLRTPEGWRELHEGEVVAFAVGERGAHQVLNRTDQPVLLLVISEMAAPEVVVYPDTDKVAARSEAPGAAQEGLFQVFRSSDRVDYWEGEQPPVESEGEQPPEAER
jgi:uncharacterized cupin superfamily protein